MKELIERLRQKAGQYDEYDWHSVTELEAADALERLTADRDSVVWGVDWAKNGDRTTVTIVKRHKDGTVEVVATEVDPK